MNRGRVSTKVLLYFLMMMFLMVVVGCSKSDDNPAPATTYSITGTVALTGGPLQNVVVTLSGSSTGTFTTGSDGKYSFTGLANGTYTLTPALTGYVFNPNPIVVVVSGSNMVQDFVATANPGGTTYSISGTVYLGPATTTAVSGVTVTLAGAHTGSVVTGSTGTWTFTGLLGGNYTVTASLSGYSITPVSFTWNPLSANSSGNIFYATLAKFSQADLVGSWVMQALKTNGKWLYFTGTVDVDGNVTFSSCKDSTGSTTCPTGNLTWTINNSTGVITEGGTAADTDVHMTMASNKTFIAGTGTTSVGGNPEMRIAQKKVPGTVYAATDVQSKSFVFHDLMVGASTQWEYAVGSTDGTGLASLTTHVNSTGTDPTGTTNVTFSVDSNGVVTAGGDIGTFTGFLSADKKAIVGITTEGTSSPYSYSLYVFNITNGQSSSTSQVAGTSYDHILAVGVSPAPFWAHQSMDITSGGVITYNGDWVDSYSGTGPTGSETISIGSSGAATLAGSAIQETSFNGQLSYDGKFMVATQTTDTGVYALNIITQ